MRDIRKRAERIARRMSAPTDAHDRQQERFEDGSVRQGDRVYDPDTRKWRKRRR